MKQSGNGDVVAEFKSQGISGVSTQSDPQLSVGGPTQEVSFPH